MQLDKKILSDITVHMKYAKYLPEKQRRETWEELVDRNMQMHIRKFPFLEEEIKSVYSNYVVPRKVLPSMRSLQFGGKAIEVNNARLFNCAYLPVDSIYAFSETMFLLLGGSGVGYSVQNSHVDKLPEIQKPNYNRKKRFLVTDDIMGWADAIKALFKSYTGKTSSRLEFDLRDIREKGATLVTAGGKAPGAEPLRIVLTQIEAILREKEDGEKLTSLECHDIMCHIADSVLSGGIRRSAMISLFDMDDHEMINCKSGNWWEINPQRGRANNSAVVLRHKITKPEFDKLWERVEASGSGEPGIYFSNDKDFGTNPCCFVGETEILTPEGYSKLSEVVGETELLNKNGDVCNALVWSTGIKEVVQLSCTNGVKLKCTPDHRFMLNDGSECEAKDAKKKRLMPYFNINEEVSEFTKLGFIQGDGGLGRLNSEAHKGLEINIGEKDDDILELFGIEKRKDSRVYYVNGYNELLKALKFDGASLPVRGMPLTFDTWELNDKLMFAKGMYSANGSVIKAGRVSYKTTSKALADDLLSFLLNLDIKAYITTNKEKEVTFTNGNYICRESYDVNIASFKSIMKFANMIGFVHNYKKEDLKKIILDKSPLVTSIKSIGSEEVFDFSLDDETHWGVVEGVIAHNCEIGLRPNEFCNLVELNVSDVKDQEDFNDRCRAGAFLGTLQASYTNFHYLRDIWRKTTEKDALLGVSMTGIASGDVMSLDFTVGANIVKEENKRIADLIGIRPATRQTCVKPAGTTSLVVGSSSGIHAWHNDHYIRRLRVNKNESIYSYLSVYHPEILEDEFFSPETTSVISIPQKAPQGAITRHESPIDLLERVKKVSKDWIKPGHIKGENSHNVSCTVTVKDNEWKEVGEWMWNNREHYNGLSVLPFNGGTYKQTPFEDCSEEDYNNLQQSLTNIDLTKVVELNDNTSLNDQAACSGGACEIR